MSQTGRLADSLAFGKRRETVDGWIPVGRSVRFAENRWAGVECRTDEVVHFGKGNRIDQNYSPHLIGHLYRPLDRSI